MINIETLTEILGWIAFAFIFMSCQAKLGKNILKIQGLGNAFWTVHFFMGGVISGTITCLICTLRSFLGAYLNGEQLKHAMMIAMILPFIVVYVTTNDVAGYFASCAAAIVTSTAFFKDRTHILRLLNLIACFLWLTFGIMVNSTSFIAMETVGIFSIILGAVRHEEVFAPLREKLALKVQTA